MLRSLEIRNYLLVRELKLEFSPGLTVITGETGAGKSMIAGALDVVLGTKFPRDCVASYGERAVIEAVLLKPTGALPESLEINDASNNEWIVRREVSRQGRTRSFVNDAPVSADALLQLRSRWADFHGQREHQFLFDPNRQLEFLDIFAGSVDEAAAVSDLYAKRQQVSRELRDLQAKLSAQLKERALLSYQLEEIEKLGLKSGEEAEIEGRMRKLESAERLAADAAKLLEITSDGDAALLVLSGQARNLAQGIAKIDPQFEDLARAFGEVDVQIKDLAHSLQHYASSIVMDEAELGRLRDRRGTLWTLKRKHGLSVEQILERAGEIKSIIQQIEKFERDQERLDADARNIGVELVKLARALSEKRKLSSRRLTKEIMTRLPPLGFADPRFEIQLQSPEDDTSANSVGERGFDRIQFLFAPNPGSKLQSISEVASGGESSRVTLAIKSALAHRTLHPLLVYDEVDIGISGKVADQVGIAIESLAKRHQVLVVTHLAQIAARADHHLLVSKDIHRNETVTSARFLAQRERVEAIASLIAGLNVTEKARASASELLRASGKLQTV